MALRCRPGDLAFVVGAVATPEMIGHVVKVLRHAVHGEPGSTGDPIRFCWQAWIVESASGGIPLRLTDGTIVVVPWRAVEDQFLRPIRPNDGEDEILRIAGKPIKETA